MFELMSMMFILMFSELAMEKKQQELELHREELIQKMEELFEKRDELQRQLDSNHTVPYTVPEIRPPYDHKKKVDK